jgi:hypothetical protein
VDPGAIAAAGVTAIALYLLGTACFKLFGLPGPVAMLFLAVLVKLTRAVPPDSLLEGDGFEPSVPRKRNTLWAAPVQSAAIRLGNRTGSFATGTGGSESLQRGLWSEPIFSRAHPHRWGPSLSASSTLSQRPAVRRGGWEFLIGRLQLLETDNVRRGLFQPA